MAILTVDELREHVETALGDAELQRLLDAAEEAILAFLGPGAGTYDEPDAVNELISARGDLIMLGRPASEIVSIVEGTTTLAADDYQLRSSGTTIRRLDTGTNRGRWWRGRIDVTYVPMSNVAERERVQIALVKLEIANQPGLVSERIGEWSETFSQGQQEYTQDRQSILRSLLPVGAGIW